MFVYSDFVQFWPEHESHVFDASHGWETYPFEHGDRLYTAIRAFEPDPSSLRQIYYAPNHVRAWTRAGYTAAGGHDPELPVCDDHDLICRTYLAGVQFHHIPKVLYLYRERAGEPMVQNSYRTFRDDGTLERVHHRNQNRYTWKLIHSWCVRAGLPMYDLGGRIDCPATYKSIDLRDADIICDVTKGLPFEDSTVGIFRAADFLEHIPREHVIFVMNELWRCLVPGGWIISRTPSTGGKGALVRPHARVLLERLELPLLLGPALRSVCARDQVPVRSRQGLGMLSERLAQGAGPEVRVRRPGCAQGGPSTPWLAADLAKS